MEAVAQWIKSHEVPTIIFAANDTMALGARSALVRASHYRPSLRGQCLVCGYDAIEEMKCHIEDSDPFAWGTIDQDHKTLTESLAHVLDRLFAEEDVREVPPVTPKPVVQTATQWSIARSGDDQDHRLRAQLREVNILVRGNWEAISVFGRPSITITSLSRPVVETLFRLWVEDGLPIDRKSLMEHSGTDKRLEDRSRTYPNAPREHS